MLETTFDKQTQTEQEGIYARKVSFKKPIETLKSILKENVKKYFEELKIRIEDITGNDGAFFIFKNGA